MSKAVEKLPLEARVIQCITDFPANKTTQDNVDQLAAEFQVANLLRTHAEKRYEVAKRGVVSEYEDNIATMRETAASSMNKVTAAQYGEDYTINFAVNKPAMKCDVDELRTELVKRGVDVELIDKAISKVTKKSTPALIISATRTE